MNRTLRRCLVPVCLAMSAALATCPGRAADGETPGRPLALVRLQAPTDRFQAVLEVDLSGQAAVEAALDKQGGGVIAYECDGSGRRTRDAVAVVRKRPDDGVTLQLLLDGLTRAGEERCFALAELTSSPPPPSTDLSVDVTDEEIIVSNTYLRSHHARRGQGGFPADVEFRISGDREHFTFEDRLFEKATGYYALRNDANSAATVVERSALKVVVEARGRYYDGGKKRYARGNARVTYRYTYHAYSPVIEVEAVVEQDDDFAWPERHFLHLSRKDNKFGHWAGGDPLRTGDFTDSRTGHDLGAWGVMYNAHDAAGVWAQQGVVLFDGVSEYYNYLKSTFRKESPRRFVARGRLYFGPARRNARSIGELLDPAAIEVSVSAASPAERSDEAAPNDATTQVDVRRSAQSIRVATRQLVLDFVAPEAGGMGMRGLYGVIGRHQFLTPGEAKPLLWRLELRGKGLDPLKLDNTAQAERSFDVTYTDARRSARLHMRWHGVDLPEEPDALDVRVVGEVSLHSALTLWRIYVDNRSRRYGLWSVHFPVLTGVAPAGTCDVAVPRSNWGMLYKRLANQQGGSYPSANWPMQFLTINCGEDGLYLGAHDPGARPKGFWLSPGQEFRFDTRAENMGVPGSDYEGYYPCAIGVFQGDWATGCKLYRQWAINQPWTAKGKLRDRKDVPDRLKKLALWMLGGGTADEAVPGMLQANDFFGMPIGIHWYNWHQIAFDTHYPEYFPYKAGFPEGVKRLTDEGIVVMPYINGRLWDQEIPSFAERALPYCTKDENLVPYTEVYGSKVKQGIMCPYTPFWQDTISEVVRRLIEECGVNAVYLDQIGAAGPKLCFDPTHGHPLGGGTYWVDGYRELLRKVQKHADAHDAIITTENNAEPYMDGVDAFLIWNPRHPDEIPMMTTVYSDYTTYFSSRAQVTGATLRAFMMSQGRDFIWGCQLGWLNFDLLDEQNRDKAQYLRRLGQYRQATRKFVTFGELLGELKPTRDVPRISEQWQGWRGDAFAAQLPAVMGSVWRGDDGSIGLFMVNLDTAPHDFAYRCDLSRIAGDDFGTGGVVLRRIAPEGAAPLAECLGQVIEREEHLGPAEVRVIEIRPRRRHDDLIAETVRTVHEAAGGAGSSPSLPRDSEARCDAAWRYVEQQRGKVDEGVWLAAADFLTRTDADLVGFRWDADTAPQRVAAGDEATVRLSLANDGRRPIEYALSRRATPSLGIEAQPLGAWHRLRSGEKRSLSVSAKPQVAEGQTPIAGTLVEVLHFRTNRSAYEVPLEVPLDVVPRMEAHVTLLPSSPRAGEPFAFQVAVRRNADWPMTGAHVHIDAPPEWELLPGRNLPLDGLKRGEERTMWVLCDVPADAPLGDVNISAAVVQAASAASVEVQPARPRASAPRTQVPPTIDADLPEWKREAVAPGGPPHVKVEGWRGPADLSAKMWLAWDPDNLYFATEVTDDAFSQPYQGHDVWQGDCIQLALRPGAPLRGSGYDGVTELGLALTPDGPAIWQWIPEERVFAEGTVAVKRQGDRTYYEAALPWQALGVTGANPPRMWTWSVTVNDRDGDEFRGWLEWTPGICGGKDASQFGILDLAD